METRMRHDSLHFIDIKDINYFWLLKKILKDAKVASP